MGTPNDGAVAGIAGVCTAAGMAGAATGCVGAASLVVVEVLLLLGRDESPGGMRPNDRPTADVPTTVAVAQSCITRMHQLWRLVQILVVAVVVVVVVVVVGRMGGGGVRRRGDSGSGARPERSSRHCDISKQNKFGAAAGAFFFQTTEWGERKERERQGVVTDGTVFILAKNQAAGDRSVVEAPVTTCRALWHVEKEALGQTTDREVDERGREWGRRVEQAVGQEGGTKERRKGRTAQAPAPGREVEHTRRERADGRVVKKCSAVPVLSCVAGIDIQGFPAHIGISDQPPMARARARAEG